VAFEDILRNLLSRPDAESRCLYLQTLDDATVERAASHLFCHIDIHIAEGHRTAADTLLRLAEDIADLFEGEVFPYLCSRRRARLCRKWGDTRGALDAYRRAWQILDSSDLHEAQVEVLMELGILLDQVGDREAALQSFRKAASICRRRQLGFNWAAALFNMASIYLELGDEERFHRYAARVARLDRTLNFPSHRARLELLTANWMDRWGRSAQSMEHYRKALDAYRQVHDRLKASEILAHLGEVARISGQEDVTGPLLGEALGERRALDAREAEGRFYYYRGITAWQVGLIPEAAQFFQKALDRFAGLCSDAEQETRYRLFLCLNASGRVRENLPTFLESRGSAEVLEDPPPHDPHVGSPHPPLQLACDPHGRPETYRAPNGDGASLEDFHQRRKARAFVVDRGDLAHLMNALASWMKQEGRKDLARQLRREARVIEGFQRRVSSSTHRKTSGRNS
jgi:tetratricopeptide (TPR) repeat protein